MKKYCCIFQENTPFSTLLSLKKFLTELHLRPTRVKIMIAVFLLGINLQILQSFEGSFCSSETLYRWVKGQLQLAHSWLFIGPLKEFM